MWGPDFDALCRCRADDGSPAVSKGTFAVLGSTGNVYTVTITTQPSCSCPDFQKRGDPCKHLLFV